VNVAYVSWGEDGLWEHGIHHRAVLEVPLLFQLTRSPAPGGATEPCGARAAMSRFRRLARRVRRRFEP